MELTVYDVAARVPVEELTGRVVVVVDMMRTTSVMVVARHNGVAGIVPCLTIDEAREQAARLAPDTCLLGGERGAVPIPGFDLGNSPLEYSPEAVRGKTLFLTTSNGTRAIRRAQTAGKVLIGACLNSPAVADEAYRTAQDQSADLVILCAGTRDRFSLDDFYCAGLIVQRLVGTDRNQGRLRLADSAVAARRLYEVYQADPLPLLRESAVYRQAVRLGIAGDLDFCLRPAGFTEVPAVREQGVIY